MILEVATYSFEKKSVGNKYDVSDLMYKSLQRYNGEFKLRLKTTSESASTKANVRRAEGFEVLSFLVRDETLMGMAQLWLRCRANGSLYLRLSTTLVGPQKKNS